VPFRVFAQSPPGRLDPAALVRAATTHFAADLTVLAYAEGGESLLLELTSRRYDDAVRFEVTSRAANEDDRAAARRAEQRGNSAGMAELSERCPAVWTVTRVGASDDVKRTEPADPALLHAALLNLCGILASVALGPVLPPDESALFGVRGAMTRVEALTGHSLSR
jgi:hypothetical protein